MVAAVETLTRVRLVEDETEKLVEWARQNEQSDATIFGKSQAFAQKSWRDRKSTRLNSSHQIISYAVFCLKKKINKKKKIKKNKI